jgi:hypothetical protein
MFRLCVGARDRRPSALGGYLCQITSNSGFAVGGDAEFAPQERVLSSG